MEQILQEIKIRLNSKSELINYLNELDNIKQKLNSKEKEKIQKIINDFVSMDGQDIVATWVLGAKYGVDDIVEKMRQRGVFRYSNDWEYTLPCINMMLENCDVVPIDPREREFLEEKKACSWLRKYYRDTEKRINLWINERYQKRLKRKVGLYVIETSLSVELMVFLDIFFRNAYSERFNNRHDPTRMDDLSGYSAEEISVAVSYLISLCKELTPVNDKKSVWIDVAYIMSNDIKSLVIETAKYKSLMEWELQADYLRYHFCFCGNELKIYDDTGIEKDTRTGFVTYEMFKSIKGAELFEKYKEWPSLKSCAEYTYSKMKDDIFVLMDANTIMSRYRMIIHERIMEELAKIDGPEGALLYAEEAVDVEINSNELFITPETFLKKKVTPDCTMKDVILFRRFFVFSSILQDLLLSEVDKKTETLIRSLIPVFNSNKLLQPLEMVLGSRDKVDQLLELFCYKGDEILDIQYTPIIKISDTKYYVLEGVLARSNLFRNAIARSRKIGNQDTNSDGVEDPLEKYCYSIFSQKSNFKSTANRVFTYAGKNGEADLIVWTDSSLFLFECKNNILPTSSYEMRTTFDYVKKACAQLSLSKEAFADEKFRETYFDSWGISNIQRDIYTCIVLGNRVLATSNSFEHSVRYVNMLDMILNTGIIQSGMGTWSCWENNVFSEKDLINYLSKADGFSNGLQEAMEECPYAFSCGKYRVTYIAYAMSIVNYASILDKHLRIIEKDEEKRERLIKEYIKR